MQWVETFKRQTARSMSKRISAALATRLEKVAIDNGFDQELSGEGIWFGFASTQAPLRLWLSVDNEGLLLAAFSQLNVAKALDEHGMRVTVYLPKGASACRSVPDVPALHRMIRRAFQLSRTLPDELLLKFEKQTATLPTTTEVERLVVRRIGQDIFRDGLLDYWQGRCAISDLAEPELLRASHIKPWADCRTGAERLDVFNGLLLAPHFDAAFDRGFISLADDQTVVVSPALSARDRQALGLQDRLVIRSLTDSHRHYLAWHREHVFKRS